MPELTGTPWWRCEWEWECFRCSMPFRCLTSLVILSLCRQRYEGVSDTRAKRRNVYHIAPKQQPNHQWAHKKRQKKRHKATATTAEFLFSRSHRVLTLCLVESLDALSRVSMLSRSGDVFSSTVRHNNRQQHRQFHFYPPERYNNDIRNREIFLIFFCSRKKKQWDIMQPNGCWLSHFMLRLQTTHDDVDEMTAAGVSHPKLTRCELFQV